MIPVKWLCLALAAELATASGSIVVSHFASKRNTRSHTDAASCAALPSVIDKLLLAGFVSDGTPLVSSNLFSLHYPAGTNPTARELYATINQDAFGPKDNKTGAIESSAGWNRTAVIADDGYGEQEDADYAEEGGLPAFCRFGGQIQTSPSGSRAHFEVWLPLPGDLDDDDVEPSGFTLEPRDSSEPNLERRDSQADATKAEQSFTAASTSGWTKRLMFIVGGGLRGTVAYPELKQALGRYRVAVAGTNMGHFSAGNGTLWIPDNPEAWTDFGHRAVHLTTMASQLTVKTFYGTARLGTKPGKDAGSPSGLGFYSYFEGCSTGGRAGMAEVQRYPNDFDGVLVGCPAFDYNYLSAYQIHVNSFLKDNTSSAFIPRQSYKLINQAVLKSCDAQDGVVDGVVSLPHECKPDFAKSIGCTALGLTPFDPAEPIVSAEPAALERRQQVEPESDAGLPRDARPVTVDGQSPAMDASAAHIAHKSDDDDDDDDDDDEDAGPGAIKKKEKLVARCHTDPQLETLKNIYSDYYIDGKFIREAVLPGSEFAWRETGGVTGKTFSAAPAWFHYQVLGDKVWNNTAFKPFIEVTPELIEEGQKNDPGGTINFNPDLSAYFNKGGKLLHYHGYADQLVTFGASAQYYDMVKAKLGDSINDHYRFFPVPGMAHCRGGTGPFNFGGASQATEAGNRPLQYDAKHDMFLALVEWVEKGTAPETIIGAAYKTKFGTGPKSIKSKTAYSHGVLNTRLLCPYPTRAQLKPQSECSHSEACAFQCI